MANDAGLSDDGAIVLFSGGADSLLLLYEALERFDTLEVLEFEYERRPPREREQALKTINRLGLPHRVIHLPVVPTYMLMLAYAAALARQSNCSTICAGIIGDDKYRPGFQISSASDYYFRLAGRLINMDGAKRLTIWTPLRHLTKSEVMQKLRIGR